MSSRRCGCCFSGTLIVAGYFVVFLLALPHVLHAQVASEESQTQVEFLCPSINEEHPFWGLFLDVMQAASNSLDMQLHVRRFETRFDLIKSAKAALAQKRKPDYLVFPFFLETGEAVLQLAEEAGVYCFTVNMPVPEQDRTKTGVPGSPFTRWLGGISPDEQRVGRVLCDILVNMAKQRSMVAQDGLVHLVGMSGAMDTPVSLAREQGLRQAVARNGAVVDRVVYAFWMKDIAARKMAGLIPQTPKARVVWAASESMALGARRTLQKQGMDAQYLFGGVDWSCEGMHALADGRLDVSLGGHFMEGAWALVCLYDHRHGNMPPSFGLRRTRMWIATRRNASQILKLLDTRAWRFCDFTSLSLTKTHRKDYDFSLSEFLRRSHVSICNDFVPAQDGTSFTSDFHFIAD